MEVGLKAVKKVYRGDDAAQRVQYIQRIYQQLEDKHVPHVDALTYAVGETVYVAPKGIAVVPRNEKELLQAVTCVLQALQVCTILLSARR